MYLGLELELCRDVMAQDVLEVNLFSNALRSEVSNVSYLFLCGNKARMQV